MSEIEQFLQDTEQDVTKTDVFEQSLDGAANDELAAQDAPVGEPEEHDFQPKNRRERRLLERLQAERESSMFLAGKLEARSEATRAVTEEEDYLKAVEKIYGTESPEAQLATELLKKAIVGARDDAERRAYERMRQDEVEEAEAVSNAEDELDSFIEEIEDEYGVQLSPAQEAAYFQLMERMSPKDRSGNVIEYADPHAVWEVFSERVSRRTDPRQKDLAARSMTGSGASLESNLQDDSHARFLRENGII